MNHNINSLLVFGAVLFSAVLFIIFSPILIDNSTSKSMIDLPEDTGHFSSSSAEEWDNLIEKMYNDGTWSKVNYDYIKEGIQTAKIIKDKKTNLLDYLDKVYFELLKKESIFFLETQDHPTDYFNHIYTSLQYFHDLPNYKAQTENLIVHYTAFNRLSGLKQDIPIKITDMSEYKIRSYLRELKKLSQNTKIKNHQNAMSSIANLSNRLKDTLFITIQEDLDKYLTNQYNEERCNHFRDKLNKEIPNDEYLKNHPGIAKFIKNGNEDLKTHQEHEQEFNISVKYDVNKNNSSCEEVFGKFTYYVNLCKDKQGSLNQNK